MLDAPSRSVGTHRNTKPVINEFPVKIGTIIVVFTDGLRHAGSLSGSGNYDPYVATKRMLDDGTTDAQFIADTLLDEAVVMDSGRPRDDISVLVISVKGNESKNLVRRLQGSIPI